MHEIQDLMHVELQVAMNFIISYLYNKLPRTRVHLYGEELEKLLRIKFMGHWYPGNPMKGSAFRCVHLNSSEIDPSFEVAAARSGLDFRNDIKSNLPAELSVWVDPGEVSYAIGGPDGKPGPVKVLFKYQRSQSESQDLIDESRPVPQTIDLTQNYVHVCGTNTTFNPYAKDFLPSSPDAETHLSSHNEPSTKLCYSLRPQRKLYTVNEFASTKFGSTKVKSNTKNMPTLPGIHEACSRDLQMQGNIFLPPSHCVTNMYSLDIHENMQYEPGHRPSSLPTFRTTSLESSSGSSTSSSPDHSNRHAYKVTPDPASASHWTNRTALHIAVHQGLDSWPKEQEHGIATPVHDGVSVFEDHADNFFRSADVQFDHYELL